MNVLPKKKPPSGHDPESILQMDSRLRGNDTKLSAAACRGEVYFEASETDPSQPSGGGLTRNSLHSIR